MGMTVLCDGCGIDIAGSDRASVNMSSIEGGSVQVDLCWSCASPLRVIPAVMDECRKRRDSILAQRAVVTGPGLGATSEDPAHLTSVSVYPELDEADAQMAAGE